MTKIEKENYRRARGYLYKATPDNYNDILHDAYVNYFRRTGKNLFVEPRNSVIFIVKREFWEFCRLGMYKKDGVRYPKQYSEFADQTYNSITPHEELVAKETYNTISNRINTFYKPTRVLAQQVLDLRLQGYTINEVADALGIKQQRVSYYLGSFKKDRVSKMKSTTTSNNE